MFKHLSLVSRTTVFPKVSKQKNKQLKDLRDFPHAADNQTP